MTGNLPEQTDTELLIAQSRRLREQARALLDSLRDSYKHYQAVVEDTSRQQILERIGRRLAS